MEDLKTEARSEVLRPGKYMRASPLPHSTNFSSSSSNQKMLLHLKKLISKQIRIHKKASSIIDDIPPDTFQSSLRIPIRTSRLSPHMTKLVKLDPLPSQTPQPRVKKLKLPEPEILEQSENPLTVLKVYKKKLQNRKVQVLKLKKHVEIGIGTRDLNLSRETGNDMFYNNQDYCKAMGWTIKEVEDYLPTLPRIDL